MSEVIFCDQCNSENVVIKQLADLNPQRRAMSGLVGVQMENGKPTPMYYGTVTYVAMCFDCGNKIEWQA